MQTNGISKGLKGKDLITVGIFSAIYFVINFAFMLMSGIHPIIWMLLPGFIALFTGIPYMLMVVKVQKPGAVFLMGLITSLIYLASGQLTVIILITYCIAGLLAEVVRYITKYSSFSGNLLSFVLFSLSMIGSPLPIWLFRDSFLARIRELGMSGEYVMTMSSLITDGMLVLMIVSPVIGALIGAVFTKGVFKKHFQKAGIV